MLRTASNYTEKLLRNAGHWNESEIQAVHAKAAKAVEVARWAGPPPAPKPESDDGDSGACGFIAEGATVLGVVLIPVSGGLSGMLGVLSAATGAGDLTGSC